MTTLPEFLRERITEQSARAHTALEAEATPDHLIRMVDGKVDISEDAAPFSVRWFLINQSPRHAIQDAMAKMRLLELHGGVILRGGQGSKYYETATVCKSCEPPQFSEDAWPCPTLRTLALAFAGHPDYQEAWKP